MPERVTEEMMAVIYFEDQDVNPAAEVFTDIEVARERYKLLSQNWNCHLLISADTIDRLQRENAALVRVFNELMDHILANRGTDNVFVNCFTYSVPKSPKKLPKPYADAEKALADLSSFAEARDQRLRAEGAAVELRELASEFDEAIKEALCQKSISKAVHETFFDITAQLKKRAEQLEAEARRGEAGK